MAKIVLRLDFKQKYDVHKDNEQVQRGCLLSTLKEFKPKLGPEENIFTEVEKETGNNDVYCLSPFLFVCRFFVFCFFTTDFFFLPYAPLLG